jgi:hypothetical protein
MRKTMEIKLRLEYDDDKRSDALFNVEGFEHRGGNNYVDDSTHMTYKYIKSGSETIEAYDKIINILCNVSI